MNRHSFSSPVVVTLETAPGQKRQYPIRDLYKAMAAMRWYKLRPLSDLRVISPGIWLVDGFRYSPGARAARSRDRRARSRHVCRSCKSRRSSRRPVSSKKKMAADVERKKKHKKLAQVFKGIFKR